MYEAYLNLILLRFKYHLLCLAIDRCCHILINSLVCLPESTLKQFIQSKFNWYLKLFNNNLALQPSSLLYDEARKTYKNLLSCNHNRHIYHLNVGIWDDNCCKIIVSLSKVIFNTLTCLELFTAVECYFNIKNGSRLEGGTDL